MEVAKVVKNLANREKEKPLSTCEKKLLTNARSILVSEFILSTDDCKEKAEERVDMLIGL